MGHTQRFRQRRLVINHKAALESPPQGDLQTAFEPRLRGDDPASPVMMNINNLIRQSLNGFLAKSMSIHILPDLTPAEQSGLREPCHFPLPPSRAEKCLVTKRTEAPEGGPRGLGKTQAFSEKTTKPKIKLFSRKSSSRHQRIILLQFIITGQVRVEHSLHLLAN